MCYNSSPTAVVLSFGGNHSAAMRGGAANTSVEANPVMIAQASASTVNLRGTRSHSDARMCTSATTLKYGIEESLIVNLYTWNLIRQRARTWGCER